MIIGIGTDIIEVERIQKMIVEYGESALNKIFTEIEIEYCNSFGKRKYEHFAARFAIKEAFSKAIGTGLTKSFKFKDVGVVNETSGKPKLVLTGEMQKKWGSKVVHISIAHTINTATAYVVIEE